MNVVSNKYRVVEVLRGYTDGTVESYFTIEEQVSRRDFPNIFRKIAVWEPLDGHWADEECYRFDSAGEAQSYIDEVLSAYDRKLVSESRYSVGDL